MSRSMRRWSLDSLALIFSIIVAARLLVHLIPQGEFHFDPYPQKA